MPFTTPNLIEAGIAIPSRVQTDSFVIRPLEVTDAEADYNAVMESRDQIVNTFGPDHPWPPADLTLEQNRIDLAWHQKEHQRRDSFTFTVHDLDSDTEFGCLYIQPSQLEAYDAAVYYWVSETARRYDIDEKITTCIREWIADDWPLENVIYPGRDLSWNDWETQKSNSNH